MYELILANLQKRLLTPTAGEEGSTESSNISSLLLLHTDGQTGPQVEQSPLVAGPR